MGQLKLGSSQGPPAPWQEAAEPPGRLPFQPYTRGDDNLVLVFGQPRSTPTKGAFGDDELLAVAHELKVSNRVAHLEPFIPH